MYGKEEFISNLKGQRYYNTLLGWLKNFSDPKAFDEIHKRHDDMPDNMPECYVVECAKWYVQVKMCDVQDFVFRKNGMKAEEVVYHYPPYHPGAFLAVLYALFESDQYRWDSDDNKFKKLEEYMLGKYADYLYAIKSIVRFCIARPIHQRDPQKENFTLVVRKPPVRLKIMDTPPLEVRKGSKEQTKEVAKTDEVQLSVLFSQELLNDDAKRMAFVKVIRGEVTPKVVDTSGSREAKWKWPHVQQALFDSKHIVTLKNKNEFGRSMSPITGCTASSISQTFKRFEKKETDANIILAIRKLIDGAIAKAQETNAYNAVGSVIPRRMDVKISELPFPLTGLASINHTLASIAGHILSLEPYFCPGCTKDILIDGFEDFAKKFESLLVHFDPKRENHVLCHIVYRLWNVAFIRGDVPALEEAIQLSKSLHGEISAEKLCEKLTGCLYEHLPEDVMLFYNLFEHNFRLFMQSKGLNTERKHYEEDVIGGAHEEYVEVVEEKERARYIEMIEMTLRTKEFFNPYVSEAMIYEFYLAMHRELSNVVSLVRLVDPKHLERGVAKIVGELLNLNIYKPNTSRSKLARIISKNSSVNLLVKNMHDGTKDEKLNSWIRMFWSDMQNMMP